ncbi:MAG: SET domain-containing protein-lysine N-methyltransferase [Niabella sp.]
MFFFNKKILQPTHIEVRESSLHGRGVFTKTPIARGVLIERAPLVFLSEEEKEQLKYTKLFNYYFLLGNSDKPAAFGFGFSAFYNHSPDANAYYSFSRKRNTLNIYAYKNIAEGSEVTINYNGTPTDKSEVYFPQQHIE